MLIMLLQDAHKQADEQASKRESEHTRGEWAHKREGGNSNRASAIMSGANNGGNNTITSSNGSSSVGDSENGNSGNSRNSNSGDSGKGKQQGGLVHMNQEARASECKLGAGETDSKAYTNGKDHKRGGRCT